MKAALHSLQSVSDNGSHPLPAVNFQHPDFPVFRGSVYQCPASFRFFLKAISRKTSRARCFILLLRFFMMAAAKGEGLSHNIFVALPANFFLIRQSAVNSYRPLPAPARMTGKYFVSACRTYRRVKVLRFFSRKTERPTNHPVNRCRYYRLRYS